MGRPVSPGQRTSVTAGCSRKARASASALAAWRASRRSSVPSPRWASQASMGPGSAPVRVRASRRRWASAGSAAVTWPSSTSPWPGQGLGVAGDGEVGAEREGALPERGGGGVVDGQQRAGGVGGRGGGAEVAHVEAGVGGGLDEQQRRAVQHAVGPRARGGHLADLDAERGELGVGEGTGDVVAVGRQDDRGTGPGGERGGRRRWRPSRRRR